MSFSFVPQTVTIPQHIAVQTPPIRQQAECPTWGEATLKIERVLAQGVHPAQMTEWTVTSRVPYVTDVKVAHDRDASYWEGAQDPASWDAWDKDVSATQQPKDLLVGTLWEHKSGSISILVQKTGEREITIWEVLQPYYRK